MAEFETIAAATAAVDDMFQNAASQAFMVPVVTGRFLVTPSQTGGLVVAFGGGGFYGREDDAGKKTFIPVVSVDRAYVLTRETAAALAQAITMNLAVPFAEQTDGE